MLRPIGHGAFGDVWIARNVTGVLRAIKVVWRDRFTRDDPYEREFRGLQRFARISLECPRQLALLHVGRNDAAGFFYSVMELADDVVGGRQIRAEAYTPLTLRELRTRRGHLPAAEAIRLGADLASALVELHQQGLIHRDIKPSNVIMVGGVPKLADVGLVAHEGDAPTEYIGTAGFVPPEGPGTPQADIYAMGKVLYELSSGLDRDEYPRLPVDLETRPDRAGYFELNEIIDRACSRDPARRFATAGEMFDELNVLLAGASVLRLRAAERWGRRVGRAAIVLALLCLALGWAYRRQLQANRARRDMLAESYRQQGIRLANGRDSLGAMPWLIRAAELRQAGSRSQAEDMEYLGSTLEAAPQLEVLHRYSNQVNDVRFRPDGTQLAVALESGEIDFWSRTGAGWNRSPGTTRLFPSPGLPPQGVQMLRFSADGRDLVCVGDHGAVVLTKARFPGIPWRVFRHDRRVHAAALSPDRRRLATAGDDAVVRLWRTDDGLMSPEEIPGVRAQQLAFSPGGDYLATCGADGLARMYDVRGGIRLMKSFVHPNWVYDVEFSPDGRTLATACADQEARLWDVVGALPQRVFPHLALVTGVRFAANGEQLLTVARDGVVRRWDLVRLMGAPALFPHPETASAAECNPGDDWLAVGGAEGVLRLWNLRAPAASRVPGSWTPIHCAGRWLAITNTDAGLPLPSTESAGVGPDRKPLAEVLAYATAEGGGGGFLGCYRTGAGVEAVWRDPAGTARRRELSTPCLQVLGMEVASGRLLYLASPNEALLLDVGAGRILFRRQLPRAVYRGAAVSPGGEWATLEASTHVEFLSLRTGEDRGIILARAAPAEPYFLTASAFSPDGRYLVVAGSAADVTPCSCVVYRITPVGLSSQPLPVDIQHRDGIRALAFSPDSSTLVTVGEDREALAWSTRSWQRKLPAMRHEGEVWRVAISADGARLLTASESRPGITDTLCLWDLATGLPVSGWIRVGVDVRSVGYLESQQSFVWLGPQPGATGARTGLPFQAPFSASEADAARAKAMAQMGFRVSEQGSLSPIPFASQWESFVKSPAPLVFGPPAGTQRSP